MVLPPPIGSDLFGFGAVDDAGARILHDGLARPAPDAFHGAQERLGLRLTVEFQVDEDVVGIVLRAQDLIATNAGALAVGGIAVEGLLPLLEARNGVLDSDDGHRVSFRRGRSKGPLLRKRHATSSVRYRWGKRSTVRTSPSAAWAT